MTRNGNSVDFSAIAYWRYVVGVLVALFAIPALLQGGIAFFRAFFDTLVTMLLAVNVVVFGAIAAGVGVFFWQRERQLISAQQQPPTVQANPIEAPQLQDQLNQQVQAHLQQHLQHPNPPLSLNNIATDIQRPPQQIQPTLNTEVQKFNATVELTETGDVRYHFPKSNSPTSEPCQSLIQAQLARRLNVSSSTIGKRKHKPDFSDWAQAKDPEGLLWQYCCESKQFYASSRPT